MLETYKRLANQLVGVVNNQQRMGKKTREAFASREVRKGFLEAVRLLADQSFCAGILSEASLRVAGGKVLATVNGAFFPAMKEDRLGIFALVSDWAMEGQVPPLHLNWHRLVYANTDARAVVLCQPAAATLLAHRRVEPLAQVLVDAADAIGGYALVEADDAAMQAKMDAVKLLALPGYGVLCWGDDLMQAIARVQAFERLCEISLAV
jgi:ribulose-5-phosphate 4-epimerase/fuculose-1-phosphate aldolase